MADRQISKEEFEQRYGRATAGAWGEWTGDAAKFDWFYSQDPAAYDYSLELWNAKNRENLPYGAAVKQAQLRAYGRERPGGVMPMNAENRAWLQRPMSSPLPERDATPSAGAAPLEQVVAQAAKTPPPKAPSASTPEGWRRMAGRWGLPALAALGGFSLLAAATGVEQPREPQPQAV